MTRVLCALLVIAAAACTLTTDLTGMQGNEPTTPPESTTTVPTTGGTSGTGGMEEPDPPPPEPTCEDGFADCDGDEENGCEVALATNADHCDACGHTCLLGACEAGACQPFTLYERDDVVPTSLTRDDDHIYFYDMGETPSIDRVAFDGSKAGEVTLHTFAVNHLRYLAYDDGYVLFSSQDTSDIERVPATGGNPLLFVQLSNGAAPRGLHLDGDMLYFLDAIMQQVRWRALWGGPLHASPWLTDPYVQVGLHGDVALTPTHFIWTTVFGSVYTIPRDATEGKSAWLEDLDAHYITADADFIYAGMDGSVVQCDHDGEDLLTIVSDEGIVNDVIVTPDAVYWASRKNGNGRIRGIAR